MPELSTIRELLHSLPEYPLSAETPLLFLSTDDCLRCACIDSEQFHSRSAVKAHAEEVISKRYQELLQSHLYKGCVCVKPDDLTAYLRQLTKRQDLTSSAVSELLRTHQMADMDASGRVTKKIDGHRCVHLLPPNHWKIQNS